MKFDMHVHTTYSDGNLHPKEIIELAKLRDLDGISITDHDSILGVAEALATNTSKLKIIPGIEFSCHHNSEEVHILGYFIDYDSQQLLDYLNNLVNIRIDRAQAIIGKLNQMDINISLNNIKNFDINKKDFIGRLQIAKALQELKYVKSTGEAFKKYLGIGMPAYVAKESLGVKETINLINEIGGISVLAHPGLLKNRDIVDYCRQMDIDGIECIHSKHSLKDTSSFINYAKYNNLIITGGSDCHGRYIDGELLLGKFYCKIREGDILYDYI